uniref:ISXO2-like transposase domain-containing protein n=1 Tax=Acrobeloides nanus TaxID=290746 RepID=A0A914DN83_9BILA
MFGAIERGSGRAFMKLVNQRDAATLLPIIQDFVRHGTTIMSDLWRAYGGIQALPQGYQHLTVNHSVNFVDPDTGVHTQNIENTWMRFKKKLKKSHGLNTANADRYSDYLQEFMWRQQFGDRKQSFFNLWNQIATLYPCLN